MYISKKDLLAMTGISYGQLYRWKRERLIPEEWFIKQAAFTGQETFFPREQILSRIHSILELKDKYSLEELAKLLSPEVTRTTYSKIELKAIEEFNEDIWELFQEVLPRNTYEYVEILIMLMAIEVWKKLKLEDNDLLQFIKTLLSGNSLVKVLEMNIYLIQIEGVLYTILVKEEQNTVLDERMKLVYKRSMSDLSNELKMKYKDRFR